MEAKFFVTIGDRRFEGWKEQWRSVRCTPGSALTSSRTSQQLANWLSVFGRNASRHIT